MPIQFGGGYDEGTNYNPGSNLSALGPVGGNPPNITTNPITGGSVGGGGLAPTIIPITPPVATTPPPVVNVYQGLDYYVHVVEGIRAHAGDFQVHTTGALHPTLIQADGAQSNGTWNGLMGLTAHDNAQASCSTVDGVSSTFAASGFNFDSVPEEATIIGIKVTVKRRKF